MANDLTVKIGASLKDFDKALSKGQKKLSQWGDQMKQTGRTLSTRVTAPITALGALSVRAFDKQIQAEQRLQSQLEVTGEAAQAALGDFKEFASGLQEITTVGDESTLEMLSVAKSMGLTNEQAKRAAKNSIALAKSMGMSERSAIRYTAALEQGNTTMLNRYLPTLREIEDDTERAAKAQELLEKQFRAATAEAKNGLGPMRQFQNTIGDLSEEIGGIITEYLNPLVNYLSDLASSFRGLEERTKRTIVAVGGIAAAIGPALVAVGALSTALAAISWPVAAGAAIIAGLGAIAAKFISTQQNVADFSNAIKELDEVSLETLQRSVDSTLDLITQKLVRSGTIWGKTVEAFRATLGALGIIDYKSLDELQEGLKDINKEISDRMLENLDELPEAWKHAFEYQVEMGNIEKANQILRNYRDTLKDVSDTDSEIDAEGPSFDTSIESASKLQDGIKNLQDGYTSAVSKMTASGAEFQNVQEAAGITAMNAWERFSHSLQMAGQKASLTGEAVTMAFQSMADQSISSLGELAAATVNTARKIISAEIAKGIAAAVRSALTSLPFPLNIAAGASAGAAAAGLFNSIVPELAEGGLAYGPTTAIVGDNPNAGANPEVIAPLDKLQGMMGGGTQHVVVEGQLKGTDIFLSNQRGKSKFSR